MLKLPNPSKKQYFFYLFKCKDNTLYSGITNDLKKRESLHNSGRGAKYTKSRGGGKIVYFEKFKCRGNALSREAEVKKWPRKKKQDLIQNKPKKKRA